MPDPGTVNNPSGTNSFDHFAPEPAYGEGTKDKALQTAAPLAGGKVAAGKIAAPKQAQRQAAPAGAPRAAFGMTPESPVVVPQAADPAATWKAIAATPGAEQFPILSYYAGR